MNFISQESIDRVHGEENPPEATEQGSGALDHWQRRRATG